MESPVQRQFSFFDVKKQPIQAEVEKRLSSVDEFGPMRDEQKDDVSSRIEESTSQIIEKKIETPTLHQMNTHLPINLFHSPFLYNKMIINHRSWVNLEKINTNPNVVKSLEYINEMYFEKERQKIEKLRQKQNEIQKNSKHPQKKKGLKENCNCCCIENYCKSCSDMTASQCKQNKSIKNEIPQKKKKKNRQKKKILHKMKPTENEINGKAMLKRKQQSKLLPKKRQMSNPLKLKMYLMKAISLEKEKKRMDLLLKMEKQKNLQKMKLLNNTIKLENKAQVDAVKSKSQEKKRNTGEGKNLSQLQEAKSSTLQYSRSNSMPLPTLVKLDLSCPKFSKIDKYITQTLIETIQEKRNAELEKLEKKRAFQRLKQLNEQIRIENRYRFYYRQDADAESTKPLPFQVYRKMLMEEIRIMNGKNARRTITKQRNKKFQKMLRIQYRLKALNEERINIIYSCPKRSFSPSPQKIQMAFTNLR